MGSTWGQPGVNLHLLTASMPMRTSADSLARLTEAEDTAGSPSRMRRTLALHPPQCMPCTKA